MNMLQMGIKGNMQTAFVNGRRETRGEYAREWGTPAQNRKATEEIRKVVADPTVPQHFEMNKRIKGSKTDPYEKRSKNRYAIHDYTERSADVVYSARASAAGQGPYSTNIKKMSYVPGRGLNVTFVSGATYNYPQQYAAALDNIRYSYSPGRTFIAAIKNTGTPYTKISNG